MNVLVLAFKFVYAFSIAIILESVCIICSKFLKPSLLHLLLHVTTDRPSLNVSGILFTGPARCQFSHGLAPAPSEHHQQHFPLVVLECVGRVLLDFLEEILHLQLALLLAFVLLHGLRGLMIIVLLSVLKDLLHVVFFNKLQNNQVI